MTDIPAPRRKCYGLKPGQPCPAYDDGTWPEGCSCMDLRRYDGSLTTAGVVIGLILFAALFLSIWAFFDALFGAAHGADNHNPHCLTKQEARAKYPNQVIYWRTVNRCWGIERPGQTVNRKLKGNNLQAMPVDGNGNAVHHSDRPRPVRSGPTIFFPSLMSGGGTDDIMLRGEAMQTWPAIADFDVDPPVFLPWLRATGVINR